MNLAAVMIGTPPWLSTGLIVVVGVLGVFRLVCAVVLACMFDGCPQDPSSSVSLRGPTRQGQTTGWNGSGSLQGVPSGK